MKKLFISLLFSLTCFAVTAQRYELSRKDTSEVDWVNGKKYFVYKVEKGETIFSICKRFKITEDDLTSANPDLKFGLKNKMRMLIPAHVSAVTKEPEKKADKKREVTMLKVALLLPLNLWMNFIPDSVYEDSSGGNELTRETLSQLEFYEGALRAIESIAGNDFKIHLSIFDNYNDTVQTALLLNNPRMREMNYLVASGNPPVMQKISRFSMTNHIPLLSFSLNATDVIRNNPYAFALTPSSVTQCYKAGKFCSEKFKNSNVLVVKSGSSKENDRANAFLNGWNDNSETKARAVDYSKGNFIQLLASMVMGANNILFIPTSNEDFVNSLVTKLNDTTDVYRITVFGIPTWQFFESNDPAVMENLNTHLFTSGNLDPDNPAVVSFRKFYRAEYLTEPTEYAFQGYDAMMLISRHRKDENTGIHSIDDYHGLFSEYDFKTKDGTNENQFIRVMRYSNYELQGVK